MMPLCQHLSYYREFLRPLAELGFLPALIFFRTIAVTVAIAVAIAVSITVTITVTISITGLLLLGRVQNHAKVVQALFL